MKTIYLIRHSAPFVEFENYSDYKNSLWADCNRNMILSSEGEEKAKRLCDLDDMKNLDTLYSADSYRAIGTAKYVAELNNLKIRLDSRINERELGVKKINELPENFTMDSFNNKDLKYGFGESLNEVDGRFVDFINELLKSDYEKSALFIHGIILMSFLQNNCDFEFDGHSMKLIFNDKIIYDDKMKNPLIFKIVYDNEKLVSIENVECE